MENPMNAAFVALTVTAGIASAGIASLASDAAVSINASRHSGLYAVTGPSKIWGETKLVSHRDPDHPAFLVLQPLAHRD
jgi:hypothetical protein